MSDFPQPAPEPFDDPPPIEIPQEPDGSGW